MQPGAIASKNRVVWDRLYLDRDPDWYHLDHYPDNIFYVQTGYYTIYGIIKNNV